MKKRLILSLLCVVMLAALLAVNVFAGKPDEILYIDGTKKSTTVAVNDLEEGVTVEKWISDNTQVATVEKVTEKSATVTAVAVGECEIEARLSNSTYRTYSIRVQHKAVTEIVISKQPANVSYHAGEAFDPTNMVITAQFDNGEPVTITDSKDFTWLPKTFSEGDKYVTIYYGGQSATVYVSVKAATIKSISFPKNFKTEYEVGEKAEVEYMNVTYADGTTGVITTGFTQSPSATTALDEDVTKITVKLDEDTTIKATLDITVGDAKEMLDPDDFITFVMKKEGYPIGYNFKITDVDYLQYSGSRTKTLKQTYFADYGNTFSLEVLDNDGDRKATKSKRTVLESADILVDKKTDKQIFALALFIDDKKEFEITSTVQEDGSVAFTYNGKEVTTYEKLTDALNATVKQDKEVKDIFTLSEFVNSKYPLVLTMGKDESLTTVKEFSPAICDVEIDLNGHAISLNLNTIAIDRDDKTNTVTFVNSGKTDATVKYYDQDGSPSKPKYTVTLKKGEELVFSYDKALPGVYTIKIETDGKGHVANGANSLTAIEELTAAKGESVTLRIIPNTDYEIDKVTYNNKDVTADKNYSVQSTGNVTYALFDVKEIGEDGMLSVTFKAKEEEVAWTNPFTDVSKAADYYDAVRFVTTRDPYLFKGTDTDKFSPSSTMTRAMFVTVLGRLAGISENTAKARYGTTSEFKDCQAANNARYGYFSYAVPYIAWANEIGLVEGYGDGNFGPENPITHQQMYTIMVRYAKLVAKKSFNVSGVKLNVLDKTDVADWAMEGVQYATKYTFLVTKNGFITPKDNAKRSELAVLLRSFCLNVLGEEDK